MWTIIPGIPIPIGPLTRLELSPAAAAAAAAVADENGNVYIIYIPKPDLMA